ncbi:MAG: Fe(3+) ABC transporter substrate-binding protein [Elainellaceae cyanobacterium]
MKLRYGLAAAGFAALVASCATPTGPQSSSDAQNSDAQSSERSDSGASSSGGVVNVYSSRHYDTDDTVYDSFTKETGIKINLIEGDADELISRLQSEGSNSPGDVLLTVDAGRLWRAEEAELFQPTDSETLTSTIPESLQHPDGLWYGLTQRARVIVYSKDAVDPSEISSYEELADPEWEGRVCIRSSSNIYNQSLLGSMIESEGIEATEEWASGIVENLAREPEGGDTDQIKAVAAGQCDVAVVNHYYWARLAKSEDGTDQEIAGQTGVIFPNQGDRGTHVNISGAGVLKNAPNPENAIAFIEYLVSPEAQEIYAVGNNEYPVLEGVATEDVVTDLGEFERDTVNVSAYGRNNPEAIKLADRVGWK